MLLRCGGANKADIIAVINFGADRSFCFTRGSPSTYENKEAGQSGASRRQRTKRLHITISNALVIRVGESFLLAVAYNQLIRIS